MSVVLSRYSTNIHRRCVDNASAHSRFSKPSAPTPPLTKFPIDLEVPIERTGVAEGKFKISIRSNKTILDLKTMIAERTKIPAERQRLVLKFTPLDNKKHLRTLLCASVCVCSNVNRYWVV